MFKIIKYVILLSVAFYVVRTYAYHSISEKYLSCLKGEHLKSTNRAEIEAVWKRATTCVDNKANFVDRIWFNKDATFAGLAGN